MTIIPNGCDLERFEATPAKTAAFLADHPLIGDEPFVLYAGTLGQANGVTYLVEVAAAMLERRSRVRFVIVGQGAEEEKVRSLAETLGVLNVNLFLFPRMPKQQVALAFSAAAVVASVFVDLPELEVNSANKFFDGLAAGKPIAVNYGGWQAELLASHRAGIRLSRDPSRAAEGLDDLIGDPAALARAGAAARRLAEDRFSRDALADRLERTLLEATSSRRADRA